MQTLVESFRRTATAWRRVAVLALTMLALQMGGPTVKLALRYERSSILEGQWWRLLTGHLVHLGWVHCLLNLAGLCLCMVLAPALFRGRWLWVQLLVLSAGISVSLLVFEPGLDNYVGLSGVVYGLLVLGLLPQARRDWGARICLVGVIGWMGWQLLVGPAASEEQMIGGRIIGSAHGFGVVIAIGVLMVGSLWRRYGVGPR